MIQKEIKKHKNGMVYCQLVDDVNPYNSALGWGVDEIEAEMNAWNIRKQIIEVSMSTNPTMAMPVETLLTPTTRGKGGKV